MYLLTSSLSSFSLHLLTSLLSFPQPLAPIPSLPFWTCSLVPPVFPCVLPFPIFRQKQHCHPDSQALENCSGVPGLKPPPSPQKHMKSYSALLVNRKVNILNHTHQTGKTSRLTILGVCQPMGQLEPPSTAGGIAKWHNCSRAQSGNILRVEDAHFLWSSNLSSRYIPQRNFKHRHRETGSKLSQQTQNMGNPRANQQ